VNQPIPRPAAAAATASTLIMSSSAGVLPGWAAEGDELGRSVVTVIRPGPPSHPSGVDSLAERQGGCPQLPPSQDVDVVGPASVGADSRVDARRGTSMHGTMSRTAGWPGDAYDALAAAARDGDTVALAELLERIDSDGVVRVPIRRVLMNPQTVEDVSQDVLIQVAERIGMWDGRSRFTTWLYTVARNKAIDHLRRIRPTSELPTEMVSDQRRVSSMIATRHAVQHALAALPDSYRTPVVLRDVEQLSYDDIARILQLHPATVRTRVSRGRALVAAQFAKAS
jgi:RNA polymerase sigma factor (sigma-70 family)